MRDAEEPDEGGRIPIMPTPGSGGPVVKYATEADLDAYKEASYKQNHALKLVVGWMVPVLVVLAILLGVLWGYLQGVEKENTKLKGRVATMEQAMPAKATITMVNAAVAKDTMAVRAVRTDLTKVGNRIGAVASEVHAVRTAIKAEDFATKGDLTQAVAASNA